MVGGLSLFTQVAIVGAVMYMFHDIIVKAILICFLSIFLLNFKNNIAPPDTITRQQRTKNIDPIIETSIILA